MTVDAGLPTAMDAHVARKQSLFFQSLSGQAEANAHRTSRSAMVDIPETELPADIIDLPLL